MSLSDEHLPSSVVTLSDTSSNLYAALRTLVTVSSVYMTDPHVILEL